MRPISLSVPDVRGEFDGVVFGDRRLDERCERIAQVLRRNPAAPFPQAMGNDSDTQGFYRFCRNSKVDMAHIDTRHFEETAKRIEQAGEVIVCHDTTTYTPASASAEGGFYEITSNNYGLYIHLALASSLDNGLPLGVLAGRVVDPRPVQTVTDKSGQTRKRSSKSLWKDPNKQSRRWFETVLEAEERLAQQTKPLHVFDTEADSYETFAELDKAQSRFICRLKHDRASGSQACEDAPSLFTQLGSAPLLMERQVVLAKRKNQRTPKIQKTHPDREQRLASFEIRAEPVTLYRHEGLPKDGLPETLDFYAVAVREIDAPPDCEPVCWNLLTTEPVTSAEQAAKVVDCYCLRWRIEEYFDVLKNGCALSERLPESRQTAEAGIALLVPIAWQLLWLRQLERLQSTAMADLVFPKERLRILRARLKMNNLSLPPRASVHHVVKALAKLGGHLSHNGPPGWRVLWRGYQDFLEFERGWLAAVEAQK